MNHPDESALSGLTCTSGARGSRPRRRVGRIRPPATSDKPRTVNSPGRFSTLGGGIHAGRRLRHPRPSEADRGHANPCSAARNSLFSAIGNAACKHPWRRANQARWRGRWSPDPRDFPVFSRRSGNSAAETGSRWTARSANQSASAETSRPEREPTPNSPRFRGVLAEGLRAEGVVVRVVHYYGARPEFVALASRAPEETLE